MYYIIYDYRIISFMFMGQTGTFPFSHDLHDFHDQLQAHIPQWDDSQDYSIPSGKQPYNCGKSLNHHAINGKAHYFDTAIFNSKLSVYQSVISKQIGISQNYPKIIP